MVVAVVLIDSIIKIVVEMTRIVTMMVMTKTRIEVGQGERE